MDLVLKDIIKAMVKENKQQLKEYEHEFWSSLKQNEDETEVLSHAIEERYD